MQVTFEVKESCTVQTPDNATAAANTNSNTKTAPTVACQLKSPYLTAQAPIRPLPATKQPTPSARSRRRMDHLLLTPA
jgi:hypothetical protein